MKFLMLFSGVNRHNIKLITLFIFCMIAFVSCNKKDVETNPPITGNINKSPIANAGSDTSITLPTDVIWLDGSASFDPDGNINSYEWKQISGPDAIANSIFHANGKNMHIRLTVAGVYYFELTVMDNKKSTGKDTIQVVVKDFTNPPDLNGREVKFDDLLWKSNGPLGNDQVATPERHDLFLNPYIKINVLMKFDNSSEWIQIKSYIAQEKNSTLPNYLFTIAPDRKLYITEFFAAWPNFEGQKVSIKVTFQ